MEEKYVLEAFKRIEQGDELEKVRKKLLKRTFYIDRKEGKIGYRGGGGVKSWFGRSRPVEYPIHDITEIRQGVSTDNLRRRLPMLERKLGDKNVPEERSFSIVFRNQKILDFVAGSKEARDSWVLALTGLVEKIRSEDLKEKKRRWVHNLFKEADKNRNGVISMMEVSGMLNKLNIILDENTAETVSADVGIDLRKDQRDEVCLDFQKFQQLYDCLTKRSEIQELFTKFNVEGDYLDSKELQNFFKQEQNETLSESQCKKLIEKYEPVDVIKQNGEMGIDGMCALIESEDMDIFNPLYKTVHQDMSQPLSHYFIDSSHNTYLANDQLIGNSKTECYKRVLLSGCRCVEIDCWNGKDGQPVVKHGHTLTSEIMFEDVIVAVNEYAFKTSEYPVILSLENHCSEQQQAIMASHLRNILNSKLYVGPLPRGATSLPSPDSLKGKIIIKTVIKSDEKDEIPPESTPAPGPAPYSQQHFNGGTINNGEILEETKKCDNNNSDLPGFRDENAGDLVSLAGDLASLVVICKSVVFDKFAKFDSDDYTEMSSFSESSAGSLAKFKREEFIIHNRIQLSRVFPAGYRIGSSNYDPLPSWSCGCQVVALNYQTPDKYMHNYKGFFQNNGSSGYVLKPECQRYGQPNIPSSVKKYFYIKVISGFRLPRKRGITDPYVQITVNAIGQEKQKYRTHVVQDNGIHPVWNSEELEFTATVPDFTLVRFYVKHDKRGTDPVIAQYCIPFTCMKEGYRVVRLRDVNGVKIDGAQLLLKIRMSRD